MGYKLIQLRYYVLSRRRTNALQRNKQYTYKIERLGRYSPPAEPFRKLYPRIGTCARLRRRRISESTGIQNIVPKRLKAARWIRRVGGCSWCVAFVLYRFFIRRLSLAPSQTRTCIGKAESQDAIVFIITRFFRFQPLQWWRQRLPTSNER
jgi:hypothetical protein